jgi:hypothetical protein
MILWLASGTVLIAIALATGLHTRADRLPRLRLGPLPTRQPEPGATSMTVHKAFHGGRFNSRRLPVDDAYTTWFNAHSRCGEALQAWLDAAPAARQDAYRAYLAELEREESAAAELESHAVALAA